MSALKNKTPRASKPPAETANKKQKTKTITLKRHHIRSYRKRHYASLTTFLVIGAALIVLGLIYQARINSGIQSAKQYVSDTFAPTSSTTKVNSAYGFSFQYDTKKFYASGIDTKTGSLFLGPELTTARQYETVKLSPTKLDTDAATITMSYLQNVTAATVNDRPVITAEQAAVLKNASAKDIDFTMEDARSVQLGGKPFTKKQWKVQAKSGIAAKLPVTFVTYTGIVNGHPMIIKIDEGLNADGVNDAVYQSILDTVSFKQVAAQVQTKQTPKVSAQVESNKTLIDSLLFTQVARAAAQTTNSTEKVTSLYSPAVVKIYNVYCMDIVFGDYELHNVCSGSSGSGFFTSSNGYIATNGHVASADPKDILITDAIQALVDGDSLYIESLAKTSGITQADIAGKTEEEIVATITNKFYQVADSKIKASNSVVNLLVDLNDKQPDTKQLVKLTDARKEFSGDANIKRAKLVAIDYRAIDGITAFKASDVAILKIDGSNFPVTKMGSIAGLSQGADLGILGFPGNAGDNGIVDSTQSKVTLTSGKVSSIKNALGSTKQLIETDTTIGHGNSGGPVLDNSGNVVGIATYTSDGAGKGDGTFNYIRDIKDLQTLAVKSSVTFQTTSPTQAEWQKGIDAFYTSHYSKALKSFNKVKVLYPQHSKADEFIAASNQSIKEGKDVKDFPVLIVGSIAGVVILIGAAVSVLLIVKHKKAHKIYNAQLQAGAVAPLTPESTPQTVTYSSPLAQSTQPTIPQNVAPQVPVSQPLPQSPVQTPVQPQAPEPVAPQTIPVVSAPVIEQPVAAPAPPVVNIPIQPEVQPQQPPTSSEPPQTPPTI